MKTFRSYAWILVPLFAAVVIALASSPIASGAPNVIYNFLSKADGTGTIVWGDNNGNVGVGMGKNAVNATYLPKMQIRKAGTALALQGTAAGPANAVDISFFDSNNARTGFIGDGSGDNALYVRSDTGNVYVGPGGAGKQLTVASNGYVGIGTTSPMTNLDVNGDAVIQGTSLYVRNPGAVAGRKTWGMSVSGTGEYFGIGPAPDNPPWDGNSVPLAIFAGAPNYSLKINADASTSVKVLKISGADLVENFRSTDSVKPEPGTVRVVDEQDEGKLKVSTLAYDKKVVGIVSGAGNVKAGVTLQQDGVLDGDLPIAFVGRVYCKSEAINGVIQPGDLLTTSTMPGYCMKASDNARANGAIIGKAMTGLKSGTGLVLVLVNLQ